VAKEVNGNFDATGDRNKKIKIFNVFWNFAHSSTLPVSSVMYVLISSSFLISIDSSPALKCS
jgi:hypothetical protein